MKSFSLKLLLSILLFFNSRGQDSIFIIDAIPLQVKLIQVTAEEVKYKLFDFQEGPVYTVRKSSLSRIRYENGETELFPLTDTLAKSLELFNFDMTMRGQQDALQHYKGKHSGSIWVGAGTVVFSPILGWIPALMVSLFPPREKNLNILDPELLKNEEYYRSYLDKAHQIKKEKVWRSYTNVTMFILLLSLPN